MADTIPASVKKQIDQMVEAFREQLTELYCWSINGEYEATAVEIEDRMRKWIEQIGGDVQGLVIGGMDRNQRKGKQPCPGCGLPIYWKGYEPRNNITSLGEMQIERAYYHHGVCRCGWVPLDERLGLGAGELSPRVQEMVSYLGGFMPFEQAQAFLEKYCHIQISHDTVNNTTVANGQALREQQEMAVRLAWETGHLPICEVTTPPRRLYVSADGINHLLPDGQGKEIKVAAVFETQVRQNKKGEMEIRAIHIEYVVHRDAEELARATYLMARKRGVEQAEQIVILGDGANWIWNRIAAMFPRKKTTEILDFYHASEYVWDAAKVVFGPETPKTQEWGETYCHLLKHEGPSCVLAALRKLTPVEKTQPEQVTQAITYFENQRSRMDYPTYVEQGLQMGSGSAESAVNRVVGMRINQTGMRWEAERAEAVAHVRTAILSNRWDVFWADFSPPARQYQRKVLPLAT
jgi:hypothetical protein